MGTMTDKTCIRCEVAKPVSAFSRFARAKDGLQRWCKDCQREHRKAQYAADPDKYRERSRAYYRAVGNRPEFNRRNNLRKYGLTPESFDAMLVRQNGVCAICRTPEPGGKHGQWHIDHDHSCCPGQRTCGKCIRGLLCDGCNIGLGHFGDDRERLLAAAGYLRWHGGQ